MQKFIKNLTGPQVKKLATYSITIFVLLVIYFITSLSVNVRYLKSELASTTNNFSQKIALLETDLATTTKTSEELSKQLAAQQNRSDNMAGALNNISGTVGTLQKLSQTDKELLQKYSKVYFLNENYVPLRLSTIDQKYLYDPAKNLQFHSLAMTFLTRMIDEANVATPTVKVVSAYRSFGTQAALKSSYSVSYGSGANKFSADQGYSEHQLGTAVDLSTPFPDTLLKINFENTQAFAWLNTNAYRYGFILSYPKGNSYYQYEPWHWRFVGVALATHMRNNNLHFYDLDQRVIDSYLANIFD